MEKIKKVFGITVFASLFFSMFISFVVSLSANSHVIDVTACICPQTHQDVFLFDEDERELAKEYKILIEKNVITTERLLQHYDVITYTMLSPRPLCSFELPKDIFYPPKSAAV